MFVRKMEEKDLESVSATCMASFQQSVAGTLSEEGVSTFSKIAATNAFLERMKGDNLVLVAEIDGKVEGVIELKEGRHVAMLFISPECQKKGIGKALLSSALNYAKVETITVSASLSSVPAYEKYGFKCKGEADESAGLVYQPMEIILNKAIHGPIS
ncbi:GNAT family N-acetyltransferase [Vibrio rumoiensis]|uniref:GNAT family N-acetyltransferase n=1 Tax=Vibrio rumoiensis TaxID=76258 RepID=A0ABW7IWS6_9VIBR|nr:GNAT family N-acetyltransferase [Vibrio rumoiensis]